MVFTNTTGYAVANANFTLPGFYNVSATFPGNTTTTPTLKPCRRLCRVRTVGFSTLTRRMHRVQPSGLVRHAASEGLSMHDKAGCHLHRQCGQTQGNAIAILRLAEHASKVCFCCVIVETKSFDSHACKAGRAKSGQSVLTMQARQTGEYYFIAHTHSKR